MFIRSGITAKYFIHADSGNITFLTINCKNKIGKRELNSILFELNRTFVRSAVTLNDYEALSGAALDRFTAAQLQDFIKLSLKSGNSDCTALLMDYSNRRLFDFNPMDEFILE